MKGQLKLRLVMEHLAEQTLPDKGVRYSAIDLAALSRLVAQRAVLDGFGLPRQPSALVPITGENSGDPIRKYAGLTCSQTAQSSPRVLAVDGQEWAYLSEDRLALYSHDALPCTM